jgi:two-component system, cell cycle sensor histidine kinase and response regulator CckA
MKRGSTGTASAAPVSGDAQPPDLDRTIQDELLFLFLRKAVEASGEVLFLTDRRGLITYVNPEFVRLYGYEPSEVVGRVTPRILKSGAIDQARYRDLWRLLLHNQIFRGEFVNRAKDGRLVVVESSANPITDDRGEIIGFLAIQRDITERKRAEASLRESEERYRTLAEAAHDQIFIINRDLRLEYVNAAVAGQFGRAQNAIVGKELAELFPPEVSVRLSQLVRDVFTGREPIYNESLLVFPGREAWIGAWLVPMRDPEGRVKSVLGVARDITDRVRLEQQFRQAQKMEAVGRLAGGVAHDFNNLLSVILGYGAILIDRLEEGSPLRKGLEEINSAGERAVNLTRQLLAFSRRQVLVPRVLDLNALVSGTESLLRRLIGEDVELRRVLAADAGRIRIDPGQLEQVIMNLVVNARDAMPRGGTLTIETDRADLSEDRPRGGTVMPAGPYVALVVSDTGQGMTPEVQSHIFEPFFTTKGLGKGTGLGLSTVYGIVKQSGGYIWAESAPGHGTTFTIRLPRVEAAVEVSSRESIAAPACGTETVLLVEDDVSMRDVARKFLESWGYTVLEAPGPIEARKIEAGQSGSIDLMLTDVVMPEMGGRALADLLAPRRPDMRVLFMSGYTDEAITEHGVLPQGTFFLAKPFSRETLGRRVREVLDSGRR